MDIYRNFDFEGDGVVLEYTTNGGNSWSKVGVVGEGINWYNSSSINAKPGQDNDIGWTDSTTNGWEDSRHDLDFITNTNIVQKEDTIRFRFAFASNDFKQHEGFAFDNIRIGERTRKVLVEHFTYTENSEAISSDGLINGIIDDVYLDAIDIQYHTSLNYNDPFYKNYPLGTSSREAYYGISDVPYTYFDGLVKFDHSLNNKPDANKLKSQALKDPYFNMGINVVENSSGMSIKLDIEAIDSIKNRQLQLFTAVVEKAVTLNESTNDLVFQNVLRRFLPNPGGQYINSSWAKGAKSSFSFDYTYNDYIVNTDTLIVVAFIQDENTKEILQTVTNDKSSFSTSIEPWLTNKEELDFILYPNPALEKVYFAFGKNTTVNSSMQIINQNGRIIEIVDLPENLSTSFYDVSNLAEGLYYIRWINNNQQKVKKLIVIH